MPNIYPVESHPQALQRKYFRVVTDTYPPEVNGVALTLARLVEGLKMLGHTVSVVRPRQWTGDRPACKRDPDVTLMRRDSDLEWLPYELSQLLQALRAWLVAAFGRPLFVLVS